jgi:hypothetical protein
MRDPLVDPQPGDIISSRLIESELPPLDQVVLLRTPTHVCVAYLGKTNIYDMEMIYWQNWEGIEVKVLYTHNQKPQ